ncbi:MAG: hypothetical protein ACLPYZ_01385 [Limisphaerales bacterium]
MNDHEAATWPASLTSAISPSALVIFRAWFADYDMAQWDKQIERDSAAGKLDRLMEEAMEDYPAGRTTEI